METEEILLLGWWLVTSLVAFALCVRDKARARAARARIRERTLLLWALIGGSAGLLVGMVLVRHKVRKPSFLARLFVIVLLQSAAVAFWFAAPP